MDVSPINLTVTQLQFELFFDRFEEGKKTGQVSLIPSAFITDSIDQPVLGLGFRNLWIQECYIGWDLMGHVTLRCDDLRLLVNGK